MKKMIIVSNRLPIQTRVEDGNIKIKPSMGGLATGLSSIHPKDGSIWVGWIGMADEELPDDEMKDELMDNIISHHCIPVSLTQKEVEQFYYGFSNRIIWPLFHYFTEYAKFSAKKWEGYKSVNRKFAEEVLEYAQIDDYIWVHDYQLMLVPEMVKSLQPQLKIGFFLHIPFPSFEVFRTLPCREEILIGILGADIIGFHTFDYQQHFLDCVSKLLPNAEVDCNRVNYKGHIAETNVYPMGIDAEKFEKEASEQAAKPNNAHLTLRAELEKYSEKNPDIKYILSIDRLDYTKGIANRIKAFDYFLKNNPWAIGKVRLLMVAVPSRTEVPQYQQLKREIDELVGGINSKYATLAWSPIWYFYRSFSFENLIELYSSCDIALITPVRDGMNLVAKEYVMSRASQKGVLILSEMTGAAKELPEALLINPISFEEFNQALVKAITMSPEEQKIRISAMQQRIKQFNVNEWAQGFIDDLHNVTIDSKKSQPSAFKKEHFSKIREKFKNSRHPLFLLDYDGTLTGFKNQPEDAKPDEDLLHLLNSISASEMNEVYIISGRDHKTLSKWFASLRLNLIAEHGVYKKRCFQEWTVYNGLDGSWKNRVKSLLEKFVKQTPGSFIEEKSHSLAWHYRKASVDIGKNNANELYKILKTWSCNLNINILNGNKVLEVTNAMVNKGTSVQELVSDGIYDFILAIGDDHTDELLFSQLPDLACCIKVGTANTCAEYRLKDYKGTRKFLTKLIGEKNQKNASQNSLEYEFSPASKS